MTEFLAILSFSVLFVAFGVLRPADRSDGCHNCSHGGPDECGTECPLLKDVFETQPEREVAK